MADTRLYHSGIEHAGWGRLQVSMVDLASTACSHEAVSRVALVRPSVRPYTKQALHGHHQLVPQHNGPKFQGGEHTPRGDTSTRPASPARLAWPSGCRATRRAMSRLGKSWGAGHRSSFFSSCRSPLLNLPSGLPTGRDALPPPRCPREPACRCLLPGTRLVNIMLVGLQRVLSGRNLLQVG